VWGGIKLYPPPPPWMSTGSQRDVSTSRNAHVFILGFHVFSFLLLQREAAFTFLGIISELRSTVITGESLNCEKTVFPCLLRFGNFFLAFWTFCHLNLNRFYVF